VSNWDVIMAEAEQLARDLRKRTIDLAEAEKAGDYFVDHEYDDTKMEHYLRLLASNPPIRSQQSQQHYRGIRDIWLGWRTDLTGRDKARAWGWGVRLAKTGGW
jgi:hypothetical protein